MLWPKRLLKLEVTPTDNPDWTADEMAKLLQEQNRGNLFDQEEETKKMLVRALRNPNNRKNYHLHNSVKWANETVYINGSFRCLPKSFMESFARPERDGMSNGSVEASPMIEGCIWINRKRAVFDRATISPT